MFKELYKFGDPEESEIQTHYLTLPLHQPKGPKTEHKFLETEQAVILFGPLQKELSDVRYISTI